MPATRAIRRGLEEPGAVSYFVVAVSSALVVLAVAGYLARPADAALDRSASLSSPRLSSAATGGLAPASAINEVVDARQQVVSVFLDGDTMTPDQISVHAGVPTTLLFTGSTTSAKSVAFSDLATDKLEDRDGMVEIRLPALVPGVYPFSCAEGRVTGIVFAE